MPLRDTDAAFAAAKKAVIRHPIAFPRNLNKGRKAVSDGEWADAGMYFGKDVAYILKYMD